MRHSREVIRLDGRTSWRRRLCTGGKIRNEAKHVFRSGKARKKHYYTISSAQVNRKNRRKTAFECELTQWTQRTGERIVYLLGEFSLCSATMPLVSVPMPSITTCTVLPGRRKTGGLRVKPTPEGVPVMIAVPGCSVMQREM